MEIRAGFRDQNVKLAALFEGNADHAKSGADAAGGKGASVALGHHLTVAGHQFGAEAADGFVGGPLFGVNGFGFLNHR